MEPQEINRAVQYVTARTSFSRDAVAEILRTGFGELASLDNSTSKAFERDHLLYTATLITAHSVIPAKLVPAKAGSGNPGRNWIPGQARNDKQERTYVVMYKTYLPMDYDSDEPSRIHDS